MPRRHDNLDIYHQLKKAGRMYAPLYHVELNKQWYCEYFICLPDTTETILRHVGLIRLNGIRVEDGFRYIAPEVLMLITSIAVYVSCTKLSAETTLSRASSASAPSTAAILPPVSNTVAYRNRRKAFFITVGKQHEICY